MLVRSLFVVAIAALPISQAHADTASVRAREIANHGKRFSSDMRAAYERTQKLGGMPIHAIAKTTEKWISGTMRQTTTRAETRTVSLSMRVAESGKSDDGVYNWIDASYRREIAPGISSAERSLVARVGRRAAATYSKESERDGKTVIETEYRTERNLLGRLLSIRGATDLMITRVKGIDPIVAVKRNRKWLAVAGYRVMPLGRNAKSENGFALLTE